MYLKKTWIYGNRIEIRKYHTFRHRVQGEKRSKRQKPTEKQIKDANERAARKKLNRLMINNFVLGDWHLTLTYAPDRRPDADGSKTCLKHFFDKMRREYRRRGEELKFIVVTEWENKNIHHHIAINNIPDMAAVIRKCWTYGGAHLTPLYADYDYQGLADYFVKETDETFRKPNNPYKQRWSCSRNLKRPQEEVEVVAANSWRKEPKVSASQAQDGYVIDKNSVRTGIDAIGYPYQEYIMIRYERKEEKKGRTWKRAEKR